MKSILIVCMGNICRSPMAQVVMQSLITKSGLSGQIRVASAGTHAQHIGEKPDPRAVAALSRRGYTIAPMRSRRVATQDFFQFDLILAMDTRNLASLHKLAPPMCPEKIHLYLEKTTADGAAEIPDPYFGNEAGFDRVLDLCETGAKFWIEDFGR